MNAHPRSETDEMIARVLQSIPQEPLPDLGSAVVNRIKARQAVASVEPRRLARVRAIISWLWSPRAIQTQWRPAYAFATLAILAATPLLLRSLPDATSAGRQQVFVQFRLDAPNAQQVKVVGDFTDNWKTGVTMQRAQNGVWTAIVPLEPGVHSYSFVVDESEWIADPAAPTVSDGFGGQNSQLAVLAPEQSRAM